MPRGVEHAQDGNRGIGWGGRRPAGAAEHRSRRPLDAPITFNHAHKRPVQMMRRDRVASPHD
jgi:hypothetical protein